MVDYWLGPKWEGIDEDNPARIAFILALNCGLSRLGFDVDENLFLSMAKSDYEESVINYVRT